MLELVSFQTAYIFFNEWAPRLIQSISCDIRDLSVCLCMFEDTASRWTGDFWSKSVAVNLAYPSKFWFCMFFLSFFCLGSCFDFFGLCQSFCCALWGSQRVEGLWL